MTARLTVQLIVLAIVAFVVGLVVARTMLPPRDAALPPTENATIMPRPRAVTPLDLVGLDGKALGPQFLEDHWTLVFFGFTHCPAVCPNTLMVLKQLNKRLATLPEAQRPRVLLVSVDPERDTPDRLRDYVQFFDRTFLAATGTTAAVEQAATAFMVPYAKVPLDEGGYTMDHGAGLYVVAPSGAIVAYVSPPLNAEVLARDYRKIVQYVEDAH